MTTEPEPIPEFCQTCRFWSPYFGKRVGECVAMHSPKQNMILLRGEVFVVTDRHFVCALWEAK